MQAEKQRLYDVVGIGNAIVDVLSECGESFLVQENMTKSAMNLIDEARAQQLQQLIPADARQLGGGSVANSIVGLAQLGAKTAFIGRVRNDELGRAYREDLTKLGITFTTHSAQKGKPTGVSYIFVTPDGERTMNTYIGACAELEPEDVDGELIKSARILLVEGYLWDAEPAKQAIRQAVQLARDNGTRVAFSLSDLFCVERHRAAFLALLDSVDILFANEKELLALYQTDTLKPAIDAVRLDVPLSCVTRHELGSILVTDDGDVLIPPQPVSEVIDSTGAGDAYAAGMLYGLIENLPPEACGALASRCASTVIEQIGGRAARGFID